MSCAVIAIGQELLSGRVLNSNATWISRELQQIGYQMNMHLVLPDEEQAILEGLAAASSTHDCLIITGGLGPTCDDLTRLAVAKLLNKSLVHSEAVFNALNKRYGEALVSIDDQSQVIEGATILHNALGTAPGQIMKAEQTYFILLPGVPHEMQALMREQVLPLLQKLLPPKEIKNNRMLHTFDRTESSIDPILRQIRTSYPSVSCGIYPNLGVITVQLSSSPLFQEDLKAAWTFLKEQLKPNWFLAESGTIEEAVHRRFLKEGWTLSCAESCTGGSLAAKLTRLPGSSQVFVGGVVAYHNQIKENLLGVHPETLETYGAVSEQVVQQMAEGILKLMHSDYGLAISGIAGPEGGTAEKPVGTVWIAIASQKKPTYCKGLHLRGSRDMIIARANNRLLGELLLLS